jgi:hypothetical protein
MLTFTISCCILSRQQKPRLLQAPGCHLTESRVGITSCANLGFSSFRGYVHSGTQLCQERQLKVDSSTRYSKIVSDSDSLASSR